MKTLADRPSFPDRGRILLAGGMIVLAVVLAYANSLHAPFVYDDIPSIVDNETIRNLGDLRAVLAPPAANGSSVNSRPLVNLSLALNYAVGGLNPFGYHVTNLAFHVLAALVLFGLVRRTCLLPRLRDSHGELALPLAAGAALLWALHPLQTETVSCTIQRTEGLVGLFYLSACYCFVRTIDPADDGSSRRVWSCAAVAMCVLGAFTKEVIATAPVILFLYDRTFVAGSFKAAWQQRRLLYGALAASWVPLLGLVLANGGRGGTVDFGQGGLIVYYYALTQCMALGHYLRATVWPSGLVLDYGPYFVSGLAQVWWQAVLLLLALGATVHALWRRPVAGFLGAWFFIILAPSSSVVPLVTQTIAEHRMYLPLAALVIPVTAWLCRCFDRRAWVVLGVLAACLGAVTVRRNADYRTSLSIWQDTVHKWPSNPRAHGNLATALLLENRTDEALTEAARAVALPPDFASTRLVYGTVLMETGRLAESVVQFEAALRLEPNHPVVHYNLGNALAGLQRFGEARSHYEQTLKIRPNDLGARMNLGNVLAAGGQSAAAIEQFRLAVQIAPDNPELQANLGLALAEAGHYEAAITAFEQVLRIQPGNADAANNLQVLRSTLRPPVSK